MHPVMNKQNLFAAILVIAAVVFFALLKKPTKFSAKAKRPLTKNEQPMYFRLIETFPELIVLAQVSFSGLMSSHLQGSRNKFNQKVADFVLCSKAFEVIAVIELDDSSHKGRSKQDADRDALLTSVGHRVIRFKRTPDVDALKTAVFPPEPAMKMSN